MASATARHILVDSEEKCLDLKKQITEGGDFAALASEHSSCPSGKQGGDLGSFGPGMMVKEFDEVVFNEAVGEVHGPVKTQFGYHLLEITSRD
ncbi:peptidylprolyl isomerase [Chromatiales bacterium (ex Bugula neritina AB1)]|nr:peptidylprolyl isomerase [Chromatiales bacterium (ex Bugula neritina AB1)]